MQELNTSSFIINFEEFNLPCTFPKRTFVEIIKLSIYGLDNSGVSYFEFIAKATVIDIKLIESLHVLKYVLA